MTTLDQALEMKERMLDHPSIAKAMRVFGHVWSLKEPEDVADQYCEFMVLKLFSGEFQTASAKLSPGGEIDEFWHTHVLDTSGYAQFFKDMVPPLGPLVHHDPEMAHDAEGVIAQRQKDTAVLYQQVFGKACPFFSNRESSRGTKRRRQACPNQIAPNRNSRRGSVDEDDKNPAEPQTHVTRGAPVALEIEIQRSTGEIIPLSVNNLTTVMEVKELVQKREGIPPGLQRLIFRKKLLADDTTLADHNVQTHSTLHVWEDLRGC